MRTCADCTGFAVAPDLDGLPYCTVMNMPLGRQAFDAEAHNNGVESANSKSMEGIAAACTSFTPAGTPVGFPKSVRTPVAGVGMNVLRQADARREFDPNGDLPSSCAKCVHYAPADVVERELGWNVGMCVARAELIPPKSCAAVANACSMRRKGANATTTDGIMLNPLYNGVLTLRLSKRGTDSEKQAAGFHSSISPRDWPTDRPVEDHEADAGIMAWRKVVDPSGYGPDAFLPIFDHTHPNIADYDGLGNLIDPWDTLGDFTPELYRDYAGLLYTATRTAMGGIDPTGGRSRTLALVGESGTGKTEFWAWFAWLMNLPLVRINVTPSMMADDFTGMVALGVVDGLNVTQFDHATFLAAYQRACVLLLDEHNSANDDAGMFLRPALDKGKRLTISKVNVSVERFVFCFLGLAMNPSWNPAYRGTREQSTADKRRVLRKWVPMPDRDTEADIIRSHCKAVDYDIDESTLNTILNIGEELRGLYAAKGITESWGVRENIAVADLTEYFDIEPAYRLVVLDDMEEAEKRPYLDAIRLHTKAQEV